MSTEKKTEDIIKDKLDSRGFAFDDKAWAGMESLLDGQEKNKKRAFFWYFSASMFIVLVAGAALVKFNGDKSEVESQKSGVGSPVSEVAEVTELKSEVGSKESGVTEIVQVTQESKEAAASVTKSKIKNQKSKAGKGSEAGSPKSDVSTQGINNNQQSVSGNKELTIGNSQPGVGSKELTANIGESATVQIPQVPNVPQESKPEEITAAEELTGQTPEIIPEPEAVQATIDTATAQAQTPESEKQNPLAAPGKETKNAWGVMAGASFNSPYTNVSGGNAYPEKSSKGFIGYIVGLNYEHELSKRLSIGAGATYSARGALNSDTTFTGVDEYSFGSVGYDLVVSNRSLHYLNVPVYFNFHLSQRHHLLIGAAWSQLLGATFKEEMYHRGPFQNVLVGKGSGIGMPAGFRKNDVSAFIGYDFTLFSRMNIGLKFNYGFFDVTTNGYYNNESIDRNTSLQLLLKYDLIKH